MNTEKLTNKYQSLLDRIESIKKKVYLRHTTELLNQLREFCSKKKKLTHLQQKSMSNKLKILIKLKA